MAASCSALAHAAAAVCVVAACGGDAPSVRLAPVGEGPCGRPADARSLLVTPLGDFRAERRPIELGAPVALGDLPEGTQQIAVEVIGDGAEVLAHGKTAPFDFGALADGDTLRVAMAPPDDVCPAGTMAEGRVQPLVAPVGGGVLVAGGSDGARPLATAEWFDPATDTFTSVPLPAGFGGARGLAGASLVPLPDGTVALVGGPSPGFAIYEHGRGFRDAVLVNQVRAHAAAVATDADTVLLFGGCGTLLADGRCEPGSALADSRRVHLEGGAIDDGPSLSEPRIDATAFLEVSPDGRRSIVVVGGTDGDGTPLTTAERIDLTSEAVTVLTGAGSAAARTDAGTIVTAFAPDGAPDYGGTAALVPGSDVTHALPSLLPRAGTVLVTQEDGLILGVGDGPPLRFLPAASRWSMIDAPGIPAYEGGHTAVLLDDGSVFLVGGRVGGAAQTAAWRFRPRLLGRFTGSITVVPADDESDPPLSPLDPSRLEASPAWVLRGGLGELNYAVVGGPVGGNVRVDLTATIATGIALIVGHVGPGDFHRILLSSGSEASVERRVAGVVTTACRGSVVPQTMGATLITLDLHDGVARVAVGGEVVLSCNIESLSPGRVGVGPIAMGNAIVVSIAVTR